MALGERAPEKVVLKNAREKASSNPTPGNKFSLKHHCNLIICCENNFNEDSYSF